MSKVKVHRDVFGIQGLCVIEPKVIEDARGTFTEVFNEKDFREEKLNYHFVQDNQCHNWKGVLRGMHVNVLHPQGKLVRVVNGAIYDVVIDLRKGSKTYKKWFGIELSAHNMKQLYIPEYFGHGFLSLNESDVLFKVTSHFCPEDEVGFAWNSPELAIHWPLHDNDFILSSKDQANDDFKNIDLYEGAKF